MRSVFLFIAALCGLTAVAMGAFGAHGLKEVLSPKMLAVYKTAVDYQIWHALALGIIAIFKQLYSDIKLLTYAGWFMFAGIVLFSGSLYLLAILNLRWLGMITPIGGVAFLIAWLLVAVTAAQSPKN